MRICSFGTCLLTAVLAVAVTCAQATTVVVTPENMQGWSIEVNSGVRTPVTAYGGLTTWGPCVYEHKGFVTEGGMPMGRGAFFAECGYGGTTTGDKTPDTVWLGLDNFNGIPLSEIHLSQIKTMNYYSYVSETPTLSDSTDWSAHTWWRGPNSPIMLQITATNPAGTEGRQFWLRPRSWGGGVQGPDGGMDGDREGVWESLDGMTDRWYHPPWYEGQWANSAELCAQDDGSGTTYGQYKFMANPPMSPGWKGASVPPGIYYSTGTGKPLNFEVGARFFKDLIFFSSTARNWYRESIGFRGHVDFFTLGIDLNGNGSDSDPGEQITYNFEPSQSEPDPDIVMSSIKAINRSDLVGTYYDNSPLGTNFARTRFMHKVFGKVVWRTGNPIGAALEDGSNLRLFGTAPDEWYESIRYYLPLRFELPAGTWVGSYWSGWGLIERLRGFNYTTQPPLMLWTDETHLKNF